MKPQLILRTNLTTINDFLRYQVGVDATRPVTEPIYEDSEVQIGRGYKKVSRCIGTRPISRRTTVFHLLGWGSTAKDAYRMAHCVLESSATPASAQ